jgi:hypothetical protein
VSAEAQNASDVATMRSVMIADQTTRRHAGKFFRESQQDYLAVTNGADEPRHPWFASAMPAAVAEAAANWLSGATVAIIGRI